MRRVASPARASVMSIRPSLPCCVKTTSTPPVRRKLPCCTDRTRSFVGSYTIVSVTVDRPDGIQHGNRNGVRTAAHANRRGGRRDDHLRLPDARRDGRLLERGRGRRGAAERSPAAAAAGGWPGRRRPAPRWRRRHHDGSRDRSGARRGRHRDAARSERASGAGGRPLVRPGRRRRFRLLRCGDERRRSADAEVLLRSDVNRPQIQFGQLLRAHDARRQQHDDFGLLARDVVAREELPEERQVDRAGKSLARCSSPAAGSARRAGWTRRRAGAGASSACAARRSGTVTPATALSGPSALLSRIRSRMISPSSETRGVMSMLTPTSW